MKKTVIRFNLYGSWFLINFIIALVPILVSLAICEGITNDVFTSYLSYNFTLLLSSLYVFYFGIKKKENKDFLFFISILVWIILLVLFIFMSTNNSLMICQMISQNYWFFALIILLSSILITFLLNHRDIEIKVDKRYSELPIKKSIITDRRTKKMADQLNME